MKFRNGWNLGWILEKGASFLRESVPRQVGKKSGVPEGGVKGSGGSWSRDRGLEFSGKGGGKDIFFSLYIP